ncbi:MAG: glycosyltransferase [Verrucomicrobiia bacterium]
MKFALFYHSLLSDWNHGNAHFLRGIVSELLARGHKATVFEPRDSWSLRNLLAEHGEAPVQQFRAAYPGLDSVRYDSAELDLASVVKGADAVIVHEWNDPALVNRLGQLRASQSGFRLYFHDTHHRLVTDPASMQDLDLRPYDGVLAYGRVLRNLYLKTGRVQAAWTWHEAADVHHFKPVPGQRRQGDLVWIGNWGDDERSAELHEFLIGPVKALGLKARVYGVRYPAHALDALAKAGIEYGGWLPNFDVPRVFAQFALTVHVPRRPYVAALPGIPTIRVFEALACGIPMICSPWPDAENLFDPGRDYLVARTGKEMKRLLGRLLDHPRDARAIADHGRWTIEARHTCGHRVDELLKIVAETPAPAPCGRVKSGV